jgi:hypothetical protein
LTLKCTENKILNPYDDDGDDDDDDDDDHHHHHHHHHHLYLYISRIRTLRLFRFRIYFSETYESIGQLVGLLGRGISPTQGLYLHTGQHNTEKRGHTSMLRVGFEPTFPV